MEDFAGASATREPQQQFTWSMIPSKDEEDGRAMPLPGVTPEHASNNDDGEDASTFSQLADLNTIGDDLFDFGDLIDDSRDGGCGVGVVGAYDEELDDGAPPLDITRVFDDEDDAGLLRPLPFRTPAPPPACPRPPPVPAEVRSSFPPPPPPPVRSSFATTPRPPAPPPAVVTPRLTPAAAAPAPPPLSRGANDDPCREARRRRAEILTRRRRRPPPKHDDVAAAAVAAALRVDPSTVSDADVARIAVRLAVGAVRAAPAPIVPDAPTSDAPRKRPAPTTTTTTSAATKGRRGNAKGDKTKTTKSHVTAKRGPKSAAADTVAAPSSSTKTTPKIASSSAPSKTASPRSRREPASSVSGVELPTGSDAESRRQRRLIRNRLSAQLHRERKREAMDTLQKEIDDRDKIIAGLREDLRSRDDRLSRLERVLATLRSRFGPRPVDEAVARCGAASAENMAHFAPPSPELVSTSGGSDEDDDEDDHETTTASEHQHKKPRLLLPVDLKKKKTGPATLARLATTGLCAVLGCIAVLSPHRGGPVLMDAQDNHDGRRETASSSSTLLLKEPMSAPSLHRAHRRRLAVEEDDDDDNAPRSAPTLVAPARRDAHAPASLISMTQHQLAASPSIVSTLVTAWLLDAAVPPAPDLVSREWVISPIEMFPSLWHHEPWTVEDSRELFDLRASAALRRAWERNDPNSKALVVPPPKAVTRVRAEDAAAPNLRGPQGLPDDTILEEPPSESPPPNNTHRVGSSFLFCPNAHASLSPGFVNLSRRGDEKRTATAADTTTTPYRERSAKTETEDAAPDVPLTFTEPEDDNVDVPPASFRGLLSKLGSYLYQDPVERLSNERIAFEPQEETRTPRVRLHAPSKALVPTGGGLGGPGGDILGGDDPYMTILLPTDAVDGAYFGDEPSAHRWIELGCQVKSARLVDGVSFVDQRGDGEEAEEEEEEEPITKEEESVDADTEFLWQ